MDGRAENRPEAVYPESESVGPKVGSGVAPEYRGLNRKEQHKALSKKLQGHYAYYGISLNFDSIAEFSLKVRRIWFKWQGRLSAQRDRTRTQFNEYLRKYPLPPPKIVHSYC